MEPHLKMPLTVFHTLGRLIESTITIDWQHFNSLHHYPRRQRGGLL